MFISNKTFIIPDISPKRRHSGKRDEKQSYTGKYTHTVQSDCLLETSLFTR